MGLWGSRIPACGQLVHEQEEKDSWLADWVTVHHGSMSLTTQSQSTLRERPSVTFTEAPTDVSIVGLAVWPELARTARILYKA